MGVIISGENQNIVLNMQGNTHRSCVILCNTHRSPLSYPSFLYSGKLPTTYVLSQTVAAIHSWQRRARLGHANRLRTIFFAKIMHNCDWVSIVIFFHRVRFLLLRIIKYLWLFIDYVHIVWSDILYEYQIAMLVCFFDDTWWSSFFIEVSLRYFKLVMPGIHLCQFNNMRLESHRVKDVT